jgi:SAM-dependent methyltransferase
VPYSDASSDRCMALLAVDWIPDARKAALEMHRVTKPAGVVATTLWDHSRANELDSCFWNAVEAIDPRAKPPFRETGIVRFCRSAFRSLEGGRTDRLEVTDFTLACQFSSFDDLWQRYLTGEGPTGTYMAGLSADRCETLKRAMRQNVLGDGADGPFALQAKAWAVRGIVG